MTGTRVSFADGVDREAAVVEAAAAFRRDGVVVLDDLLDPSVAARCLAAIERDYPGYDRPDPERNFGTYPGRFTMPLHVDDAVADRALFCPRPVLETLARLLGDDCVLDSLGLLVSLPGSTDQARHPDALLFPESPVDRLLPPVAIAFALPLVRMDEESGTTGFWTRTHIDPTRAGEQDFAPVVPVGSAMLWDFRVNHRGLANRGGRPRPVLFSVFCRSWFAEVVPIGATRHEKLTVADAVHRGFSDRMRRLTRRARVID